jgi:hypothetical protein
LHHGGRAEVLADQRQQVPAAHRICGHSRHKDVVPRLERNDGERNQMASQIAKTRVIWICRLGFAFGRTATD